MKKITKYQAEDGQEFDSEKDCLAYEKVSMAKSLLKRIFYNLYEEKYIEDICDDDIAKVIIDHKDQILIILEELK